MAKDQGIPKIWENIDNLKTTKLGKTEKASDSELLDGHDSTYFAKQEDLNTANTQIQQNKSDILSSFRSKKIYLDLMEL